APLPGAVVGQSACHWPLASVQSINRIDHKLSLLPPSPARTVILPFSDARCPLSLFARLSILLESSLSLTLPLATSPGEHPFQRLHTTAAAVGNPQMEAKLEQVQCSSSANNPSCTARARRRRRQ